MLGEECSYFLRLCALLRESASRDGRWYAAGAAQRKMEYSLYSREREGIMRRSDSVDTQTRRWRNYFRLRALLLIVALLLSLLAANLAVHAVAPMQSVAPGGPGAL